MRFFFAGFAILLASRVAVGDEPSDISAARRRLSDLRAAQDAVLIDLLRSSDAKDVAWGAYSAGRERRIALRGEVTAALARAVRGSSIEEEGVLAPIMASAVDLETDMSVDVIGKTLRGALDVRNAGVVLLMARNSEELLRAWDELGSGSATPQHYCIANELLARHAPGLCARLLGGIQRVLRLVVVDEGRSLEPTAHHGGMVSGDFYRRRTAGGPPVVLFHLSTSPERGSTLVSSGPRSVYLRRIESETEVAGALEVADADEFRKQYVAAMLGTADLELPLDLEARVAQPSPEEFVASYLDVRRAVDAAFWRVVATALQKGVVSSAEAASLVPKVDIQVADERGDTRVPVRLPEYLSRSPYGK